MKFKTLFLFPRAELTINKVLLKVCFLLFVYNTSLVAREINDAGDFQVWLHQSLRQSFGEKEYLNLSAEERWGGGASTHYLHYLQAHYAMQCTDWLEIAPGYRQTFFLDLMHRRWRSIYEPLLIVRLSRSWGKGEVACRHQVQYRIFDHRAPLWLYRLRPELFLPVKFGKIGMRPYIFDEMFFLEESGFTENRAAGALQIPMNTTLSGAIEYIYRSLKAVDRWNHQSIVRFNLNLRF